MPIDYQCDTKRNIVNTRCYGVVTISDIAGMTKGYLEDDSIRSGFLEVVSFKDVEDFSFAYSAAHAILDNFRELREKKDYKGAVMFAPKPFQYGIARMFSSMLEDLAPLLVVQSMDEIEQAITQIRG